MKLYWFATPNARKACAVARYLDAPVEFVHVDLTKRAQRDPAFLAINPNGKVPALSDGDFHLWESAAIMCYLAERAGSSLWPQEAKQRAEVLSWISWDLAHFSRHGGVLFFEHLIRPVFQLGDPDAGAVEEATGFFRQFAAVLDKHLEEREWLVADTLSIADFAVAALLPYASAAHLPVEEFPEVLRWHAQLEALPAWQAPFPVTG